MVAAPLNISLTALIGMPLRFLVLLPATLLDPYTIL